jgi:hypothetical protein
MAVGAVADGATADGAAVGAMVDEAITEVVGSLADAAMLAQAASTAAVDFMAEPVAASMVAAAAVSTEVAVATVAAVDTGNRYPSAVLKWQGTAGSGAASRFFIVGLCEGLLFLARMSGFATAVVK